MIFRAFVFCLVVLLPSFALALDVTLPASARQTAGQDLGLASYAVPIAAFDGGKIPSRTFEGYVTRQAWRVEGRGVTPLQLLQPLRNELTSNGYTVLFECSDRACGGFDFRFGTDVINAPDMFVDLDDYRFISAVHGPSDAPKSAISILVSRSAAAAYIQIIQIAVDERADISVAKGAELIASTPQSGAIPLAGASIDVAKQLDVTGHVILADLVFETGSSELGAGPFSSLSQIAIYLSESPEKRVVLVGHTDTEGSLEGNIALSKRRAASVRTRLIEVHAVEAAQVAADGVGYLAPVASNVSKAGREANRRVEAVVTSSK
ncbi:OmpA family protein [Planktotalea sp.]|uniref:OmpA family protein n=1 Tax=Planktotalea sp. TaxID=2029877 RepID=UPI003D6B4A7A